MREEPPRLGEQKAHRVRGLKTVKTTGVGSGIRMKV